MIMNRIIQFELIVSMEHKLSSLHLNSDDEDKQSDCVSSSEV
jgi:hypothetical protein